MKTFDILSKMGKTSTCKNPAGSKFLCRFCILTNLTGLHYCWDHTRVPHPQSFYPLSSAQHLIVNWTKISPESPEVDLIYQVLKQAGEISNSKSRVNLEPTPPVGITVDRGGTASAPGSSGSSGQSLNRRAPPQPARVQGSNLAVINPAPCSTSSGLWILVLSVLVLHPKATS